MVALEYRDVEVDWCPGCRGVWLDEGELGILMAGDPAAELSVPVKDGNPSPLRCPACGDVMREAELAGQNVTLDRCPHGHGWWFDDGEVRAVIRSIGESKAIAQLSDFYETLFGHQEE